MRLIVSRICLTIASVAVALAFGFNAAGAPQSAAPKPQGSATSETAAEEPGRGQKLRILKPVPPVYPSDMRPGEVTGAVRMQLVIDPTGKVMAVTVTNKLHPKLDAAAVAAAKQYVYSVPLFNDVPVYAIVYVSVGF